MADSSESLSRASRWDPKSVRPKALFDSPDLSLLCAKKTEGQTYERKSKRDPDKLATTICAFANSNQQTGGLLAVGISDKGEIDGLDNRVDVNLNRLLEYHYHTGTPTRKKFVDCRNKDGQPDRILLIFVPYLEGRVAETSKGKAYVREGDKTKELRDADKRELEYSKGQISFEDEVACDYSDELVVQEILDEFRDSILASAEVSSDVPIEQLLMSKHLLKEVDDKSCLTKAGILILGKDPRAALPGAYVRFLRYSGTEKKAGQAHNIVKDEIFSDPLPRLVQRLRDFLRSQLREFTFMGGDGKFMRIPAHRDRPFRANVITHSGDPDR